MYTNDCTANDPSVKLLKFADDTTIFSLIHNGDESHTGRKLNSWLSGAVITTWC